MVYIKTARKIIVSKVKKLAELQDLLDVQCNEGNWNYSQYMHGMANGLIVAMAVLTGEEPKYLEPPETFLCELLELDKFNKSGIIVDINNESGKQNETD